VHHRYVEVGTERALGRPMSRSRTLRYYGYVDRPYEEVRALIQSRAGDLFQHATNTASKRAQELVARLSASMGVIEVGVDVRIDVAKEAGDEGAGGLPPVTRLAVRWKGAKRASLFPSMSAQLSISPMAFTETRVEFEGTYEPPLGVIGDLLDAAAGHQVAEATVHRFVNDVIEQIRLELPSHRELPNRFSSGLAGAAFDE
jgi:hypothetical protein